MKTIELNAVDHETKIGKRCKPHEPNVTEDCLISDQGETVGFYMRKIPAKLRSYMELANREFNGPNVPKSMLSRSDVLQKVYGEGMSRKQAMAQSTVQMSAILGSIAPKPHMRRPYPSISSLHLKKSARNFIKAMLLAAKESEKLIAEIMPEQYNRQKEILSKTEEKWRFTDLFTSSISNYNIAAPFHRDTANLKGTVNVIITKRYSSRGGDLVVPDYDACFDQCDNSILVYPAWRNVHGVTPIEPISETGYRNSLVFYPLKAFEKFNKEGEIK